MDEMMPEKIIFVPNKNTEPTICDLKEFKKVDKDEYKKFINEYPRPLNQSALTICDPLIFESCDFALGNWPECVVAQCEEDRFYICINHEEVLNAIKNGKAKSIRDLFYNPVDGVDIDD